MDEEKIVIGSDGKEVSRKVPNYIARKRWYESDADNSNAKRMPSEYAVKRDPYANFDASSYRQLVEQHTKHDMPKTSGPPSSHEPIVDSYSKVVATPSQRDLKDYAHYLDDIPKLEFSQPGSIQDQTNVSSVPPESVPTVATEAKQRKVNTIYRSPAAEGLSELPRASEYAEDFFENGHTSVYGSWWSDGKWGYKCCKLHEREANCPIK